MRPLRHLRPVLPLLLAPALLAIGGCLPSRFVVDVAPARPELTETVVLADDDAGPFSAKVALIHVTGLIADARTPGLLGAGPNPVDEFVARLEKAESDSSIRAIVVRINSPGGTVTGSDIMADELEQFRERTDKPVVAALGEVAASGGYYVACAADAIIAEPTTITASIGVIIQTFNVSETLDLVGVRARAVTSAPNKDIANPFESPVEEHYALLQGLVDEFYENFRGHVLDNRPDFDATAHAELLDGRVITGARAAEVGLVDERGGLRDAFERAKSLSGLAAARLVVYHPGGVAPRSAYALADPPDPRAEAAQPAINLLNIDLRGAPLTPGFYYLWSPSLP